MKTINNMKNIVLLLVMIMLIATSCGQETSEIDAKKAELEGYKSELQELKLKITETEKALSEMDSTFGNNNKNAVLITTVKIAETSFTHKIEARGSVESRTNVMLSSELPGKIESIKVVEGQFVNKGQVLATLDAAIIRNTIAELKTNLELAAVVYQKQANLWKQNIGTEISYLESKAKKEGLERKLATTNSQLNQAIVRAPFSGSIDAIPARVGEMIQPGTPLVRIVKLQDVYIQADISERYIGAFKKGDEVEVYFPSQDERIKTKVSSVSQVINSMNRTFNLEVKIPALKFPVRPNQVVVLNLTDYTNGAAKLVPTRVIQNDNKGNFVFIIENDEAKKVHVTVGKSYDNQTEVLEGLALNTLVAKDGYRELAEGVKVRMNKENSTVSNQNTSN
jgi:membrane fusion protein, multidrug efflux system